MTLTTHRGRAVALVSALSAAALLALAVPRFLADLTLLPSTRTLERLQGLRPVDTAVLERLIRNQRRALVWQTNGRTWTDLGLAQLLIAERLPDDDPRARSRFDAARKALIEGLSVAPANPFAWSRLAYAQAALDGWTPEAAAALRMAFITGPYEPRLLWPRLRLSLLAWPHIPPDDQELVLQQIRQGWAADREALVALVAQVGQIDLAKLALAGSAADLRDFETRLASPRTR